MIKNCQLITVVEQSGNKFHKNFMKKPVELKGHVEIPKSHG